MRGNVKRHFLLRLVIAAVIALCLGVSLFFSDKIETALGWKNSPTIEIFSDGELKVHFIDVGQGDACVIELPDDRKMIIDGGDVDAADALLDYIDGNIFDDGEGKFDFAILTHADADHCGSLDDVINRYPAEVFYRPNVLSTYKGFDDEGKDELYGESVKEKATLVYKNVIEAAYKNCDTVVVTDATNEEINHIEPESIKKGDAGYYEIVFYTPTKPSYNDWNDYSPIIILEYAGKRIALSGDAEKENEAEFVELVGKGEGKFSVFDDDYYVDVIKLGHHGSETSSSQAYLDTLTTPLSASSLIVVISCGVDNKYGHPKPKVLQRLADMGVKNENIYRTDLMSNIVISVTVEDGKAELVANGNAVERAPSNDDMRWKKWSTVVIILIAADFVLLVIAPEVVRKANRKRR